MRGVRFAALLMSFFACVPPRVSLQKPEKPKEEEDRLKGYDGTIPNPFDLIPKYHRFSATYSANCKSA